MIVTCTLNPSLDYYMEFEQEVEPGRTNRSHLEYYKPAGKGINVSVVLSNLGVPSKAVGFLGGYVKDFYIDLLKRYTFLEPNFTFIDGVTRLNVKCVGHEQTSLNAAGPMVTMEDFENLRNKVRKLGKGDYFVLSGNTQTHLEKEVIEMVKECINDEVRVIIDTNYSLMEAAAEYHPLLIKTSAEDLEDNGIIDDDDSEDLIEVAKKLYEKGAQNVMIYDGEEKVYLYSKDGCHKLKMPYDEPVNMVGVGDSLVAGFITQYIRSHDALDSFRYGGACGCATALTNNFAERAETEELYEKIKVKEEDDD